MAKSPIKFPTDDEMRVRFHEAQAELATLFAKAKPAQDAYDSKRNEIIEKERRELAPLRAAKHEAEKAIHALQKEVGGIARYLRNQTALPEHKEQSAAAGD